MTNVRDRRSEQGYSLVELMLVVGFIGILGSMAMVQIGYARPALQADGVMRAVTAQLNGAREMAVTQRRRMTITVAAASISITRQEVPTGNTVVRVVPYEGGVRLGLVTTIDTPDGFGNATAAYFGTATTVMFNTDGMLIDGAGTPINGSIFLVIPGIAGSHRAVTIMGSTGRVRAYRWTGTTWTRV